LHGNSRSTVGVMLDGNVVENMVVGGQYADWRMLTYADVCWRMLTYADVCWRMLTYAAGPAYNTRQLQRGDHITHVDGLEVGSCSSEHQLPGLLRGSDTPNSTVIVTASRNGTSSLRFHTLVA
jgi:hypothetical protein